MEISWGAIDPRIDTSKPYLLYSIAQGCMAFGWRGGVSELASGLWAGNGHGKNNPEACSIKCVGPLPKGVYTLKAPVKHPRLGPYAIELIPHPDNKMYGRSDFWIHGASNDPKNRGQESMGCIIAPYDVRKAMWETGALQLWVTD